MSNIERSHLKKETEAVLNQIQLSVNAETAEHEALMDNLSRTIGMMIARGESRKLVNEYVTSITRSMLKTGQFAYTLVNIYVIFDGQMHIGDTLTNSYKYAKTISDIEKDGKIMNTEPYYDKELDESIVTYSRSIFSDENKSAGTIYMQMKLNRERIVNIELAEGGFGMLINNDLRLLAHQNHGFLGDHLSNIPFGKFITEIKEGEMRSVRGFYDYRGVSSLAFLKRINNDFIVGVVTPKNEYYKELNKITGFLILIGTLLSFTLSGIFIRIIRENEKAKEETQKRIEAEIANSAKSAFLAKMSHEIRTPMNVILGITEMQLQEGTLAPQTRESYMMIYNSGNLLLNIINDILDLSKIEAGKMEFVAAKYDIASLVNDTVQLNVMRNKSKRINFKLNIDENVPQELIGDEIRIKQILNNLLSNAFKYTEKGEVKLSISAKNGATEDYATLVFQISDTGQGMTKEQVSRLFTNEYIRFNLEANRAIEGTGLGINITNHLVQMMNGEIFVESELDMGTTFTVCLSQKTAGSKTLGKELAENLMKLQVLNSTQFRKIQFMREYMPYGKVLIVDDVETNLHVAKGLMTPYGLSIELVSSGFDAIEKIKNGSIYDIIFMDHMMPKMDGIEATKVIRELGYKHPIVVLTANALVGQAKIFLENGFDDFISKPIDLRQLNNILNKLIRDKQTPEVIAEARKQKDKKEKETQAANGTGSALHSAFARDAKNVLPILKYTLENIAKVSDDDLHLYAVKAHAMKSALANIGEITLSQMALVLEKAGKELNREVIEQKTQELIDELEAIIEKNEPKEQPIEKEDTVYLREQLKIISDACANYDIDSANAVLANLKKKPWTNETKDILDKISEHLLHSDFEEASALAKSESV
jgi:signal transduction histidine kinase/DNA-binding response OmpR family regulator